VSITKSLITQGTQKLHFLKADLLDYQIMYRMDLYFDLLPIH